MSDGEPPPSLHYVLDPLVGKKIADGESTSGRLIEMFDSCRDQQKFVKDHMMLLMALFTERGFGVILWQVH